MFCLYKECDHSKPLSSCFFNKFPSEACAFKIWKRYAGISKKALRSADEPYLCSCHFKGANEFPTPFMLKSRERNIMQDDLNVCDNSQLSAILCNEQLNVSTSQYDDIDEIICYSFDESLFGIEDNSDGIVNNMSSKNATENDIFIVNLDLENLYKTDEAQSVNGVMKEIEVPFAEDLPDLSSPPSALSLLSFMNKLSATMLENEELKIRIKKFEDKLKNTNPPFDMTFIENSDQKVFQHTGIPSKALFDVLFNFITKFKFDYAMGWTVVSISKRNQLLMTLMKLRMDLRNNDLAERFKCSHTTVSNVIRTWILAMHEILFLNLMKAMPSRFKNKLCLPTAFKAFPRCRVVLDCTENFCDRPKKMDQQKAIFSPYKHHVTAKSLVGAAPNGVLTYASDFYPGSTSDKKIVQHCGISGQFDTGDQVMADKGFLIKDDLPYGVSYLFRHFSQLLNSLKSKFGEPNQ